MKLISKPYCLLNERLHRSPRGFGGSGYRWIDPVWKLALRVQAK